MFGTIRKHQTWLWAIIITLTIISFVIFFSPYSRMDKGRNHARLGSISGKEITEEGFINAQKDAMLQYFFMSGGRWPSEDTRDSGFDLERETYQWLFLLQKIEQHGIYLSADEVAQVARNMLSQFARGGTVDVKAFEENVLASRGLKLADFERFVRNYLGIQQLIATVGFGGRLVTPAEARELWIRENQELATEAAFFNASNYLAQVTPTPEAIAQYYSNRLANYRIPERMQVKYVLFSVSNHLASAEAELMKTNLDEVVSANMERLGTNYTRLGATPEEAKANMRHEFIRQRALLEARRVANQFASDLFDKTPLKPENLEEMAAAKGLTVQTTEPFERRTGPDQVQGAPNFAAAAFSLDLTNEPFSNPVLGTNGVYVLAFDRRVASEVPSLDEVRDKVTADYRLDQATALARQAGTAFYQRLTNSMAQGKDFAAVATDANVPFVSIAPFSITTRTVPGLDNYRVNLNQLKELAFSTGVGEVSHFQPTVGGGMILHVKSKLPIDEAKLQAELPEFTEQVRHNRQNEAFNAWFQKEATPALRDTPLGQPRTPPPDLAQQPPPKS